MMKKEKKKKSIWYVEYNNNLYRAKYVCVKGQKDTLQYASIIKSLKFKSFQMKLLTSCSYHYHNKNK